MLQAMLALVLLVTMLAGVAKLIRTDRYAELLRSDASSTEVAETIVLDIVSSDRSAAKRHPTATRAQMGADAIISGVKIVAVALVGAIIVAYLYDELASLQVLTDTGLNSSIDQLIVFFGLGILFAGILILVLVSRRVLSGIDRF